MEWETLSDIRSIEAISRIPDDVAADHGRNLGDRRPCNRPALDNQTGLTAVGFGRQQIDVEHDRNRVL